MPCKAISARKTYNMCGLLSNASIGNKLAGSSSTSNARNRRRSSRGANETKQKNGANIDKTNISSHDRGLAATIVLLPSRAI